MGLRGPAPTPSKVLEARGSWRANVNPAQPIAEPGRPTCPKTLSKPAKAIWRRLMPMLEKMGVLAKIDGGVIERYCVYFARWRECEEFIAKNGLTYTLKSEEQSQFVGRMKDGLLLVKFVEYPQVKESHRLDRALKQFEDRLGLSPSARSRLVATQQEDSHEPSGKGRFFKTVG